jgi:hypothetical protein
MANIFDFTIAKSGANIQYAQITIPNDIPDQDTINTHSCFVNNNLDGATYYLPRPLGTYGIVNPFVPPDPLGSLTITPADLGYGSAFADGVIQMRFHFWTAVNVPFFEYVGAQYLLYTDVIDAGIAVYTPTSATEAANLVWMNYLRTQIDIAFADANYTLCNTLIGRIEATLISPETITTSTSVSLIDRNTLRGVMQNDNELVIPLNSPINYVEDTFTNTYAPFDNDFLVATASGSVNEDSSNVFALPFYNDGVHIMYNFAGNNFSEGTIRLARYIGYAVVTTTITEQFATFQANYDPTNTQQANAYADMLTAFATIATLSNDIATNYVAINTQIAIIQGLLAMFVDVTATLTITDKSTLLVTLDGSNLPNVPYDTQLLTLSNTNDDTQEYVSNNFPLTYVDLTTELNSETVNFGSQYADGVYQVNVSWNSGNGMTFNAQAYCRVSTKIDCGIAGIIAKRPNCKFLIEKLNVIMAYNKMSIDAFLNEDYTTSNFYINKCLNILNTSGCNCGC